MKKLTNDGLEEVDEVVEVDLPSKEKQDPEPEQNEITKEEKKEEIRKFNKNPTTKQYGVVAINRKFLYIYLIITTILILGLIATNIFWFNYSFSQKDFGTNITLNNQVESPDIPINIYNNETNIHHIYINNTIILPDEILIKVNQTNPT